MIVDPRGMRDVREWADFIMLPLDQFGVTPRRLDNPDNWKDWAFDLMQAARLESFDVADPRGFDDWVDWASRFNQVVPY
jgi:hypothetical protein